MKKKKERLFCDIVTEDNRNWLNKIGKVSNCNEIADVVYCDILKKTLDNGAPPERVVELSQKAMLDSRNMELYTKLICVNNYFYCGRQVYKFDDTISELLIEQSKADLCSFDALNQLPVSHFYVIRNSKNVPNSQGFFFSRVDDMIYISDVCEDGKDHIYTLKICEGKTIAETLGDDFSAEYGEDRRKVFEKDFKKISEEIAEYFQFVLYLSAVNAEIIPITKGAITTRQAGKREYKQSERSNLSEVGYKTGSKIRKSLSDTKIVYVGEHSKGSPKSPHIRRSHFHSYWTGSGEDKKLIVKWVNTIFVHGNDETENATVHKVE